MRFQGVIFDMDGLLIDTETLSIRAWQVCGNEMGYPLPLDVLTECIGHASAVSWKIIQQRMGPDCPAEAIWNAKRAWMSRIMEEQGIPRMPGADESLTRMKAAGMRLALGTSTRKEWVDHRLRLLGWEHVFDAVACGDEVPEAKPAPHIFLLAAERMGVKPENCVVLEDSPAGLHAARTAGMTAVCVPDRVHPHTNPKIEEWSDFIAPTLMEACTWILEQE